MTDEAIATSGAILLAAGAGIAAQLSTLLPESAAVEFLVGAFGAVSGAAVAFAVMKERVRVLTEGQRDLWAQIGELRRADQEHVRDYHR